MPHNLEFSFEETDDTKKGQQTDTEAREPLTFEEVVTPDHLLMLSRASGGFRFVEDPTLPAGRTGYTNKETKTIHYNPLLLKGSPELGIKPWRAVDIRGFTYHEAGHHSPEVLRFDEKLIADLGNPEIIPESYRGDPQTESRFFGALYSHLDNALVDMWLESYMGRRPYYPVRESIAEFQSAKGEAESYRSISKPEQLMQIVLRSRYLDQKNLDQKVDPEVFESYERIMKSGAMPALLDRRALENVFATPADIDRSVERKVAAYRQVFLPEYLKLMEAELEQRKKQRQEQKEQQSKQGQGQEGGEGGASEQGQGTPSEAVPLTKEEEQEIIEQILKQIEEAGKEFQSLAPAPDENENRQSKMQAIQRALQEWHKQLAEEKTPENAPAEEAPESGEEAIRKLGQELRRQQQEQQRRGLAEAMGVKQESIQHWERTREKYRLEIESLASSLAEVFLDDRRTRLEYLRREGEIVPGLEHETIAAYLSGELDPDTKMRTVRNPEFLETELEFIVDDSGSMGGEKIEKSIELVVIITEALKRAKENLAEENLLDPNDEEPFRVGVTKFTTVPERVTKLTEPLDDRKEVVIIDKLSEVGGGTEESGAISGVYGELTLNKSNVIKIMVALTDGVGNREGVAPIIRQIEDDKEVVFLVVGLGGDTDEAQAIVGTYLEPLREREGNVYGLAAATPDQALPSVVEFLKREVHKRRQ